MAGGVVQWVSVVRWLIERVSQRQARLVLEWVTVCGWVNHLGMSSANKVDSAFHPSRVSKMRTSFIWEGKGMVIHSVRG